VLDGRLLVDAHVHVARLATLSADWRDWVATFGSGILGPDLTISRPMLAAMAFPSIDYRAF